jgi:hypothetical protein
MPYVIEGNGEDSLIIYFESEQNRDLYLKDPTGHKLEHHRKHLGISKNQ